jgi:protein-disulfide isomerase
MSKRRRRRKLTKAQAKELALRQRRQRRMAWAAAGVTAVAVILVLVLIAMSSGESASLVVETQGYPQRGADDAPVTIVEFTDYNCSHCSDFTLERFPRIEEEFVASGQVKYVVYPYTLWDGSLPIAEAAACAHDQGGFWDFHHLAFTNQDRFSVRQPPSRDMLSEWAAASELDVAEFQACIDEGRNREKITTATQDAKERMRINSTPTILVNGVKTSTSVDAIRQAVQAAVAGE